MALPFRQRIFLILVALTAIPTTLAVIGWALSVRSAGPSGGALASLEEGGNSARTLGRRGDTPRLSPGQPAAARQRFGQVSHPATLARRADAYLRYYTARGDADRGGPGGTDGRTVGQSDGDCGSGPWCRDEPARAPGPRVRRLRPTSRRAAERSGHSGAAPGVGPHGGTRGREGLGGSQRGAADRAGLLRPAAPRVEQPAAQRRRGDGGPGRHRRARDG